MEISKSHKIFSPGTRSKILEYIGFVAPDVERRFFDDLFLLLVRLELSMQERKDIPDPRIISAAVRDLSRAAALVESALSRLPADFVAESLSDSPRRKLEKETGRGLARKTQLSLKEWAEASKRTAPTSRRCTAAKKEFVEDLAFLFLGGLNQFPTAYADRSLQRFGAFAGVVSVCLDLVCDSSGLDSLVRRAVYRLKRAKTLQKIDG